MKEKLYKYHIGVDWAAKPKLWQRLIVWFGFQKKWWDYSGIVFWKKNKNGDYKLIKYLN